MCFRALPDRSETAAAPPGRSRGPRCACVPFGDIVAPHVDHPVTLRPREVRPAEEAARVIATRDDPERLWHTNRAGVWLWSPATGTVSPVGVVTP